MGLFVLYLVGGCVVAMAYQEGGGGSFTSQHFSPPLAWQVLGVAENCDKASKGLSALKIVLLLTR